MEQHRLLIRSLVLKLHDQSDHLIPALCQNFNFVPCLQINLNNFALNFDNLPQTSSVSQVKQLTVKKNKFLFFPLVQMAVNLQVLNIYFKEFTWEMQDLKALKFLREVNITCLSDSAKYHPLKAEHFRLEFFNPQAIDLSITMLSYNLMLHDIFNRFSWVSFPVNSFKIFAGKLKFKDGHCLFGAEKDRYQHMTFYERDECGLNGTMQMLSSVAIAEKKGAEARTYDLVSFSKSLTKKLPIFIKYELQNNPKGSIEIRCKKMKIEI